MKKYELKCYEGDHQRILVNEEFVLNNNFHLHRTQEDIYTIIKNAGMLDFAGEVLVSYLDWDKSKEFYKEEFVKDVKNGVKQKPEKIEDIYETVQDMLDYLIFGYMKAMDERGISASRTINKLGHWLWLLGRDDLEELVNDDNLYNPYGMPALIALTEKLGLCVPEDCMEFSKKKVN